MFVAAEKQLDEAERKSPRFIDPKDARKLRERDQVRRDLLQTRLALARVLLETARNIPPARRRTRPNCEKRRRSTTSSTSSIAATWPAFTRVWVRPAATRSWASWIGRWPCSRNSWPSPTSPRRWPC